MRPIIIFFLRGRVLSPSDRRPWFWSSPIYGTKRANSFQSDVLGYFELQQEFESQKM